jgi:hypothetical protein
MPRSPSRDLSDRFAGNRGYFRRGDALGRAKYLVAFVALVLAVAWVVADVALPARAITAYTHGPVANPHAHWENDCAVCHKPYTASGATSSSLFHARDRWHDLTCEKCHAGPAHVATVADAGKEFHTRCSNCHHDHAGRLNSLVRIADDHCTRCHSELPTQHVTGTPKVAAKIADFTRDHPEIRALQIAPKTDRKLKFNHVVHTTLGLVSDPGKDRSATTVDRLKELAGGGAAGEDAVARYRLANSVTNGYVKLACVACHQLDSEAGTPLYQANRDALAKAGEPGRAVLPARAAGEHFLPVNFETHCRACHPLRAPEGASAGLVIPAFDVPHRRQPKELAAELNAGYIRGLVAEKHPALAQPVGPGGKLDPAPEVARRTIRDEAERLERVASNLLLGGSSGCAKCHDVSGGEIARVPDRTVWLPAAQFNHARHKPTTCATCHPGTTGAIAAPGTALVEKEPLQILGIDSCRACHSPSGTKVTFPDGTALTGGGARFGCVDCHRYHNADHGLQGRGADVLWRKHSLDLVEFLRGGK